MAMRWQHLAFLHWPIDPRRLRPLVPSGLHLETRDGAAWIGITPFLMSHVRARCLPAIPGLSSFPELNVRTYVSADDKPGVWFFSLDAANELAVLGARWAFGLPYFGASMEIATEDEAVAYHSRRLGTGKGGIRFGAAYRPSGPVFRAVAGSLEHWLTERYCLYSRRGGKLYRGEIDHAPWPLQVGSADIGENTVASPLGLDLGRVPSLVHFARRLDVVAWLPTRV